MNKLFVCSSTALLTVLATSLSAIPVNVQVTVPGTANIFTAGTTGNNGAQLMGGTLAVLGINISPGAGQQISFGPITGSTTCGLSASGPCTATNFIGADGAAVDFGAGPTTTAITNAANTLANDNTPISGITMPTDMALVGVFVGPGGGNQPFEPTYNSGAMNGFCGANPCGQYAEGAPSYPEFFLNQQFFIGDGRTGTGSGATQVWAVPTGATALYLGFDDAFGMFQGAYGAYGDNGGALNVTVYVGNVTVSGVPEPGTIALMGFGLVAFGFIRKKLV
jgi:hypothetical protein